MAIRIYGVFDSENKCVMTLQGKQMRTMQSAVADYIRCGRLPYGEYVIRMIAKEAR